MSVTDLTSGVSYATLSDAITGSSANDVIQISAGSYVENFPDITHNLTIESTGGLAYLTNPQPDPPNGRAVINVPGNMNVSLTLNGLDISGAVNDATNPPSSGGANGAGILFEFGNGALVVENCHIHNNEDGILTGGANSFSPPSGMTVTIANSEIDHNGVDPSNPRYGYDHNLYVGGPLTQLTVDNSYFHDALGGHEIKSDAANTIIMNSRIQDGPTAGTSYSVDLPYGGVATIENNVIEKGPNSPDDAFIHYGGDGPTLPNSSLTISGNTVIDDRASGQGPFVFDGAVLTSGGPIVVPAISGNTFYGPGPDNLLAGPGFFDVQPGTPYVSINNFLSITNAPTLDTSPPSTIPFVPPSVPSAIEGNATIDGSTGSRTEFLDFAPGVVSIFGSVTIGAFGNQLTVINDGNGQNTVDLVNSTVSASGAGTVNGTPTVNGLEQDVVWLEGSSSVAATVNASGSGTTGAVAGAFQPELWVVANGGSGVVNGGAQAILAFSSGNGVLSVDGGAAVGDIDVEAAGYFKSGSGGGAIMASNPLLATTLVGGGNNDVMFGIGNNTTMIAGAGSQTEASFASGGETFEGNLGSGASTTTMETFISGGNQFITGSGVSNVNALGGSNIFSEGVTGTAGSLSNVATITGFDTGTDSISLAIPGGGTYSTITGGTPTATEILVSTGGGNSTLQFGDGTTWTIVGAALGGGNFH